MSAKVAVIIGTGEHLAELGLDVSYVGEMISNLIKDGCQPMVW